MKPNMRHARAASIAGCLALLLLVGGCGKAVSEALAQEPDSNTACSLDGMMLLDFPGPKAQIRYAEGAPDFFCDLMELFAALQAQEQKRGAFTAFVQDMGETSWDQPRGNWIDAKSALYVVGSKKAGSMGPTFGSFSRIEDAQEFSKTEGGKVLRFEQITPAMLAIDSGAAHDGALSH